MNEIFYIHTNLTLFYSSFNMDIDEALLTGESLPVNKMLVAQINHSKNDQIY